MLVGFANCPPDLAAFVQFKRKWEQLSPLKWKGDHNEFLWSQGLVREIWEGKKKGIERLQVMLGLGIEPADYTAEEGERVPAPPIVVDWQAGQLVLRPRNLRDLVWLALLQNSDRLGICASRKDRCSTPYFLKYRPQQEFCSAACAQPRQREFKRRWWAEHGKEWQRKRRGNQGAKKSNQFWADTGSNHRKQRRAKGRKQ